MPGFKGFRYSKFRHVFGQPFRKEQCYDSLRISRNAHDSNFCAVNPKFLAVITESGGGGSFVVVPVENCGRVDSNIPRVCGHYGSILDIKWDPFNDDIIASSSEDGTIKIWEIPEGGLTDNLTESMVDLDGHSRKCGFIEWHPTAAFLLASAGYDGKVIIWNIERKEAVHEISWGRDAVLSVAFNWDGSLIATTCKDKKIRVIDPRTHEILQEGYGHTGSKSAKVSFVGETSILITAGISRESQREIGVWNQNDLSHPLKMLSIGMGTGVLFPFVDHDCNVVYVGGKGDGNIRYFEIVETSPYIYPLNEFVSGQPQRGFGSMPKRGLKTADCEIMRFYKLHASKSLVEPISMIVPRKYTVMQKDLYPDTPGTESAMTAKEWLAGINKPPNLLSLGGVSRMKPTGVVKPTPKPIKGMVLSNGDAGNVRTAGTVEEVKLEKEIEIKKSRVFNPSRETEVRSVTPPLPVVHIPPVQRKKKIEDIEIKQQDIIVEVVSINKTDDSLYAAPHLPPHSSVEDVDMKSEQVVVEIKNTEITPNNSDKGRQHTFAGMECSVSVSQRRAIWDNNETTPAKFVRTNVRTSFRKATEQSTFQKTADRESFRKKAPIPKVRKSTSINEVTYPSEINSECSIERTVNLNGKETFRINRDNSISVLPSTKSTPVGSGEDAIVDNKARYIPQTKTFNITENSTGDSIKIGHSQSQNTSNLVMSKDMGTDGLRKAFLRQQDEIKQLKMQLLLKDQRIRQLESELEQYTDSNC